MCLFCQLAPFPAVIKLPSSCHQAAFTTAVAHWPHSWLGIKLSTIGYPAMCVSCRRKASAYRELSQRLERQQKLSGLASKMAADREVMGKGRKRKLADADGSSSQAVYRWKRERKK
jgi:hypothetical protein